MEKFDINKFVSQLPSRIIDKKVNRKGVRVNLHEVDEPGNKIPVSRIIDNYLDTKP